MNCISWDGKTARVVSVPIPELVPAGHIMIEVYGFSIGRFDVEDVFHLSRYSKSRKRGLGSDFSGVVKSVGVDCEKFVPGEEVMGVVLNFCTETTGAEYIIVSESLCTRKPSTLSHLEVVSVLFDGLLAERTLRLVKASDVDSILISGGCTNLARVLMQIAKSSMFSVEWIACTISSDRSFVESLGADETFDVACNKGDWSVPFESGVNRKEYEIVIDIVGDSRHVKKLLLNKKQSRFVSLYNKPKVSELIDFHSRTGSRWLINGGVSLLTKFGNIITGSLGRSRKYNYFSIIPSGDGEILERIAVLLDTGILNPLIEKKFIFKDIQEAVVHVRTNLNSKGRIVVQVKE